MLASMPRKQHSSDSPVRDGFAPIHWTSVDPHRNPMLSKLPTASIQKALARSLAAGGGLSDHLTRLGSRVATWSCPSANLSPPLRHVTGRPMTPRRKCCQFSMWIFTWPILHDDSNSPLVAWSQHDLFLKVLPRPRGTSRPNADAGRGLVGLHSSQWT